MWRRRRQVQREAALRNTDSHLERLGTGSSNRPLVTTTDPRPRSTVATPNAADLVAHRASVRSIMTLPVYQPVPRDGERLIAKEGERAGIDTVVEYAETNDEDEVRRVEEMDALYHVQQTRRREIEEAAERRRERQRATARAAQSESSRRESSVNVAAAVSGFGESGVSRSGSIGAQGVGRNGGVSVEAGATLVQTDSRTLLAQLQDLRARDRRVSEVSYADLGTARHDGSRLRAASVESDQAPLLDGAASFRSERDSHDGGRPTSTFTGRNRSRSRAGRYVRDDDAISELSDPSAAQGAPLHPPSYEDDLSVYGGDAPPYPGPQPAAEGRQTLEQDLGEATPDEGFESVPLEAHSQRTVPVVANTTAPQSEVFPSFQAETWTGDRRQSAVPLRLRTGGIAHSAPTITVEHATPTSTAPPTPTNGG